MQKNIIIAIIFLSLKTYPGFGQEPIRKNETIDIIHKNLIDSIHLKEDAKIIELLEKNPEIIKKYSSDLYSALKEESFFKVRVYVLKQFFSIFHEKEWEEKKNKRDFLDKYCIQKTSWSETELRNLIYLELTRIKNESSTSMDNIQYLSDILELIRIYQWEDATYKILPFIAYPFSEVRKNTYRTFAVLKDDRIVSILLDMLQSKDPIERVYAIDALYYIHDKRSVKILMDLLEDENKSVRYYAIRTLEEMKRTEAVYDFIRIMQHDKNVEVRIKALNVLKNFQVRSAYYPMKKLIFDKNPEVRRAAISGVLSYKNYNSSNDLSKQLRYEKYKDIKLMLIEGLMEKNSWGTGEGLKKIIEKEKDSEVLLWALYCTGKIGFHGAKESVLKRYESLNDTEKSEAIIALGKISNYTSVEFLLKILVNRKENIKVRYSALWALKNINSKSSILLLYNQTDGIDNKLLRINLKYLVRVLIENHLD